MRRLVLLALLCLPLMGQGTILVRRGAPAWVPTDLTSCTLHAWFQGDSYEDAADATATDLSGNGRDATETTDSQEPTHNTNYLNGHDAIDFDGTNDVLTTATWSSVAQPNTVWLVVDLDTSGGGVYIEMVDGVGASARHVLYQDGATNNWSMYSGTALNAGTADSSAHYFVALFNGSSSYLRRDGSEVASGNAGTQGITGVILGAAQGEARYMNGKILDYGLCDGTISSGERASLESYLATRYGL